MDLNLTVYSTFNLPKTEGELHMSLSIAWSRPDENGSQNIAFSDSRGYITLVNLNNQLISNFKAHNFESWIVSFNYREPNIFYTGIKLSLSSLFVNINIKFKISI